MKALPPLLRHVSRSFYLTLRVLPAAVRPQIGLAYLLARATDTIADTELVPTEERLAALARLRARILGHSSERLDFGRFLPAAESADQTTAPSSTARVPGARAAPDPEVTLLHGLEEALAALGSFSPGDQQLIRDVLAIITGGQELDLRRFGARPPAREGVPPPVLALSNETELTDYTYRVAGCVGEFWTRLCHAHLFPNASLDEDWLCAKGVRFGQGLQLVNILRDLPADLRRGRCYLPGDQLASHGLRPQALLDWSSLGRLRPVYDYWLDQAHACLADGWAYTNALPRRQLRVRLACAWPVLIGVRTLARLRTGNVLDPACRVKVSRAEVYGIMLRTLAQYPWPAAWKGLFPTA